MRSPRSTLLASSHRYIGTTSWACHLLLAALLLGCALWQWLAGREVREGRARRSTADWTLDLAVYLYWATTEEIDSLRRAYNQWDVDGYALIRWLLPALALLGLVGGYSFLRRCGSPRLGLLASLAMGGLMLFVAWHGAWLNGDYSGEGMLSQHVVVLLPWLDAAVLGGGFLLGACLLWCALSLWRSRRLGTLYYSGALALVHGGAVLALVGGLAATALNTYRQVTIPAGASVEHWLPVADDMQVRVLPDLVEANYSGYRALARVELREGGRVLAGHALFADGRGHPPAYQGPVRQLCEILDYHYARYASDRGYVLHPFIVRGWGRDLQVWVPASSSLLRQGGGDIESLVVIRRYPLLSCVWLGLALMLGGALLLPAAGVFRRPDHTSSATVVAGLSQS